MQAQALRTMTTKQENPFDALGAGAGGDAQKTEQQLFMQLTAKTLEQGDRRVAKRNDENRTRCGYYIEILVKNAVEKKVLEMNHQGIKVDSSDIANELLAQWAAGKIKIDMFN